LAPDSRGRTWDAVLAQQDTLIDALTGDTHLAGFGPDVTFLDAALARVFATVSVDPARVAIGGFSDGATYALSLGLINADLFSCIVAFTPGFIVGGVPDNVDERPSVFVSHGRADRIFPIDSCSRRIVQSLRGRRYEVTFREFDGGHEIPDSIASEAIAWIATPV
jgi:predicted esterase